jgi:hypothetical protein
MLERTPTEANLADCMEEPMETQIAENASHIYRRAAPGPLVPPWSRGGLG